MTRPANVLYVHHGSGQGGAANSLLYLLQNLDVDRFKARVACDFRAPEAQRFFTENGFPPINLPVAPFVHTSRTWPLNTLRGVAKLCQWLAYKRREAENAFHQLLTEESPDIVHLNGLSILPLAPVAKRLSIPVLQHVRESVNSGHFGLRKRWLLNLADEYADHIIYICADGQDRLTGPGARSSVVYNPIDFNKFSATPGQAERRKLGIPPDAQVLLFPGGSLFDIKGIIPFLQALSIVRDQFDGVLAIIPGIDKKPRVHDTVREDIEKTIDANKLDNAIVRLPFSANVEKYYAASDIVVAPFILPHFSRAVIEAGAMSKPVVASRIGGIEEVLEDGVAGFLATPNDHQELARKIIELLDDRERAVAMGEAGYKAVRHTFDAGFHANSIMRVYDAVLSADGSAL